MLLAFSVAALGWLNMILLSKPGWVVPIWIPNGLVLAVLVLLRGAQVVPVLGSAMAGFLIGNMLLGNAPTLALADAFCNTAEVGIVAAIMHRAAPAMRYNLAAPAGLFRFTLAAGLIAPTLVAPAVMLLIGLDGRATSWRTAVEWAFTDGIGNLVFSPILVFVWNAVQHRPKLAVRALAEWVSILAGGAFLTLMVFGQGRYPLLFLVIPFVLLAAFRLGVAGAALAMLIVTVIASARTTMDMGPIHLVHGGVDERTMVLQLFLLATFASALPVAAALQALAAIRLRLGERERFLRSTLYNMRDVIFRIDLDGRWNFLNPAWEDLSGYSIAETLNRSARDWLTPESYALFEQVVNDLDEGAAREFVDLRFHHRSGRLWTAEARFDLARDENGVIAGLIGNLRDVTGQRADQRALWEGERRLQIISDLSPAGIIRTDAAGDMTWASSVWLQLTGMKLDDVLGTGWAPRLYPEGPEEALTIWRELIGKGVPFQNEFCFTNQQGHPMWVMTYGRPERDEQDRVTGFIVLVLDITDRKLAERKLAERERELSIFASNVSDAVLRLDLEGRCLSATPSTLQVIGLAPEAVVGRYMLNNFHPDDDRVIRDTFAAMVEGKRDHGVLAYRAWHGTEHRWLWLEANSRLVRDVNGRPREIVSSLRDVTERKEMEEALDRERRRAESATRAKSRFLASMSHEIRTPMNGVLGFADLLLAGNLDPVQREQARMIAESGRIMMRILNEILDHSKIEAGQMAITAEPVDLVHAIRRSVRLFESAARQKGIALAMEVDPALPRWIVSDGLRLRQIITNLVGNAVKFTRQGGVRVVASLAEEEEGAPRLRLDVIDTGPGIAAEQHDAIFGEFVQIDEESTRALGGTGLGLSISSRMARLMDGDITLESTVGQGSRFRLELPLREAEAPGEKAVEQEFDGGEGVLPGRVLVAEDNEINQRLIATLLAQFGIGCDVVADGGQAIAAALRAETEGRSYDLVLMDLHMPEVDGFEAVRAIRDAGVGPEQLPVVAVTANAYQEDVRAALMAGMQAHLSKPIDVGALTRILRRWTRVPAEAPKPNLNPALDALRPQFRRRLRAIRVAVASWEGEATPLEEWVALRSLCHQVAGNAALFGYPALGDIARMIDRRLAEMEAGIAPDQTFAAALALLGRRAREATTAELGRARPAELAAES